MTNLSLLVVTVLTIMSVLGCSGLDSTPTRTPMPLPTAVIDLGATVTEDLPEHFWGKAFMNQMQVKALTNVLGPTFPPSPPKL